MIDLRIRNPRVVMPWGVEELRSVDIDAGEIVSLNLREDGAAHHTVDANGSYLLPGFIDTHVHLNFLSDMEGTEAETDEIKSETRAAVRSGVTSALVYYRRLDPYGDDLVRFLEAAARSSYVDFGLHLGILIEDHLERLRELARTFTIRSFKMYTCYKDAELRRFGVGGEDDGFILAVFQEVARLPDAQIHVHAENEEIVRRATAYVAEHEGEFPNPTAAWSAARPPIAEAEAVRRLSLLARHAGCRLFIPHVSGEAALAEVTDGRRHVDRDDLLAETCPQYLLLSAEDPPVGTLGKVNPPIRTSSDSRALIEALRTGEIDVVGTDHATTTRAGKDEHRVVDARPGFAGMATLLPALMTLVQREEIPVEVVARITQRAAQLFRLSRKGIVAPGYDADLVLVDPSMSRVVDSAQLGSASDFSVFEGRELFGWPSLTVCKGRIVVEAGELVDETPGGRYVRPATRYAN